MMKNTQIEKAKKVFNSISQNVTVKVIVDNNSNYVGKLITKYTKSCAHTILFLEEFVGYEKCGGYGYNMEEHNFKNIIAKNKNEIEKVCNVFCEINNFNIFIELNMFKVITVI